MALDNDHIVSALQGMQKASAILGHTSEALVLEEAWRQIEGEPARLAAAIEEAKRKDRTALFVEVDELTDKIGFALQQAPYATAAPAMKHLEAITAAVSDPLGEHFGTCQVCDEPIFVRGQIDDDVETYSDDGDYAHRTCMDRLREENPSMFKAADDEDDE